MTDDGIELATADVSLTVSARGIEADLRREISNGFGSDPGFYSLGAVLLAEVVLTFMFLIVILGVTRSQAAVGFAGIAIGLCLTLLHLVSIPISNTSVNPARSLGPAVFEGGAALTQVWAFWVAPIVGAALAGLVYNWLRPEA